MDDAHRVAAAILAGSGDAVLSTDRNGIIRTWNPGAERIFGFSSEEAIGRSLDLIIPEPLRARHWQGYREVMGGRESRYSHGDLLSVPGLHKSGRRISLEFTIVPLRGEEDAITGMAAIMRDITARFEELKTLRKRVASGS